MPPYRANLGGAFGSGRDIRGGSGNIDIASAIREVGNQASSLIQSAYLRKIAEVERAKQANADAMLRADKQAALTLDAQRRAEDVAFRDRQLAAQIARNEAAAQPKPTYDATRGVFITPPSGATPGGASPVTNLPAKPKEERSGAAGTFYPQTNPDTGETTYFNPQTGATVKAPAGLQPRDASTANTAVVARRAVAGVKDALASFKANIETNGAAILPGATRAVQEAEYRKLLLQMKELFNLGVLNGPDLVLMESIINEPAGWITLAKSLGSPARAKKMILGQIKAMEKEIAARERNIQQGATVPRQPSAGGAPDRFGPRPPGLDPNDPD
jgi:hypothetical protein